MKYFILLILLVSCSIPKDHNQLVNEQFETLNPPIIVVAKHCATFGCSVLLIDKSGTKLYMGNLSDLGNVIGASYNVGDTLKFQTK